MTALFASENATLLKIAAALLSLVLSLLAGKYRNPDGSRSFLAVVLAVGFALGAAITLSLIYFERQKDAADELAKIERDKRAAHESERIRLPITRVEAEFIVELPFQDAADKRFLQRAENTLAVKVLSKTPQDGAYDPELGTIVTVKNGQVLVYIFRGSALWPRANEESAERKFMHQNGLIFAVSIKRPESTQTVGFSAGSPYPAESWAYVWDAQKRKMYFQSKMNFDKKNWRITSAVTSTVDVRGADLILTPLAGSAAGQRTNLGLVSANISLAHGHMIGIDGGKFVRGQVSGFDSLIARMPADPAAYNGVVK